MKLFLDELLDYADKHKGKNPFNELNLIKRDIVWDIFFLPCSLPYLLSDLKEKKDIKDELKKYSDGFKKVLKELRKTNFLENVYQTRREGGKNNPRFALSYKNLKNAGGPESNKNYLNYTDFTSQNKK